MKISTHVIVQICMTLVSVGTLLVPGVPSKYQPFIVGAISLAQGIIAWINHYYTPGGTTIAVLIGAMLLGLCGAPVHAQTAAPATSPISTFSLIASPLALPGGRTTVAGTVAGIAFTPTANFDLREDNIIAPGDNFQGFFGGFNYRLPAISTAVNNVSPNLNGYRFQFYLTGSAGVDRITTTANTAQHYAFLAGGGVNYDITGSGTWTMGVEVRYAKLPGLANNTAVISLGPSIHF